MEFDAVDTSPGMVRAAVRRYLGDSDRVRSGAGIPSDAEYVASELVTNVVRHTGEPGVLELWDDDDVVRVEVHDSSDRPAHLRDIADRHGGFGLRIVEAVSARWGCRLTTVGKTVWSDIATSSDRSTAALS